MSYTIRIHVVGNDPTGLRIIDRPDDWRGVGVACSRSDWESTSIVADLDKPGVYILWSGSGETAYIGQSDNLRSRIKSHLKERSFWKQAVAFTSSDNILNSAHVRWLEHSLIQRIKETTSVKLQNANSPNEPSLSIQDRNLCDIFLSRVLEILPLVGFNAFEEIENDLALNDDDEGTLKPKNKITEDTIIVPTGKSGGFEEVFVAQNCWYYVRLTERRRNELKYILAYRPAPESKITMMAEIEGFELFGNEGKYKIRFKQPAFPINPIHFGDSKQGIMQGPRFTSSDLIETAKTLSDLL